MKGENKWVRIYAKRPSAFLPPFHGPCVNQQIFCVRQVTASFKIPSVYPYGRDIYILPFPRLSQEVPDSTRANEPHPQSPYPYSNTWTSNSSWKFPATSKPLCCQYHTTAQSPTTSKPFRCQSPTTTEPFCCQCSAQQPCPSGRQSSETPQGETPSTLWYVSLTLFMRSDCLLPCCPGCATDIDGNVLPDGTPAPPRSNLPPNPWTPFDNAAHFLLADFLYRKVQMSGSNINELLEFWALSVMEHGIDSTAPYESCHSLYATIDAIQDGDAPWQCLSVNSAHDDIPEHAPSWQRQEYEVWYRDPDVVIRNMLDNPDFASQFDAAPYIATDTKSKRRWTDFMSGHFAWRRSVRIPFSFDCVNILTT